MLTKRTALFGGALCLLAAVAALTIIMGLFGSPSVEHLAGFLSDPHGTVMATAGLAALRSKRVELVGQMQAMIDAAEQEDRDLSAEEQTAFDELKSQKAGLDKRIERSQGLADDVANLSAVIPAHSRRGALLPRAGGPEAPREFETLGEFLAAVRFNPSDQRLNFVEGVGAAGENGELQAEMRMDNGPSGGFMVPVQHRNTIMKVPPEAALVRPRANVLEAGDQPDAGVTMPALDQGGTSPANMFGGMQFSWIGEGDDKPETDSKLREFSLTPHEIAGHVVITDKLLRNWRGSGVFLENLMRDGVNAVEDFNFQQGNGNHKPLGLLYAGATKWINRATANKITYRDLVNMVARVLMRGGGAPIWSMPQAALPEIATLKDDNGNFIWVANARDGFAGTLLGYPVRWNNRAPLLGSKGDVTLADWSQYMIKDGAGPFVATSEHVKFLQNKTVIKIFWNVDGSPWMTAPIKEENGYEVSPFVGLDVPA